MGETQFFISYSRNQLYFAEALALALQNAGLNVWMDLHQIEPGSDWQSQIDEGLRNCAALILVASKQSLASPFVESEWRAVKDSNKPVYIAYYEDVDLPPVLESASLVDFRGSFKHGTELLAVSLKNLTAVREKVPPPNRLGLPQRMPSVIIVVVGLLIIEAFVPWLGSFDRYEILFRFVCFGILLPFTWWLAWQFLHHKQVLTGGRVAIWSTFYFPLALLERLGLESGIGSLISCSLPFLAVFIALYMLERGNIGAELFRWSVPGREAENAVLRRRFNKMLPANSQETKEVIHQALVARNSERKGIAAAEAPRDTPTMPAVADRVVTYSLHFAAADNPVATSLRRALNDQSMQEVNSNAQTHIVILSENLPRSQLQELLNSGAQLVTILLSNLAFQGDALLERVASRQLIDYRDRSRPILTALAQTLKESQKANLYVGFETTPQPLNSVVLPRLVQTMSSAVFNMCGWLILSGLVALTQDLLGVAQVSTSGFVLNLVGMVCGLLFIKLGKDVLQRETTNFRIFPVSLISTCLLAPLYFGSMVVAGESLQTNAHFEWAIPLSSIYSHDAFLYCLLCSVAPIAVGTAAVWWGQLGDWLPATTTRPEQEDRFTPLTVINNKLMIWRVLILGILSTFGIPALMYILSVLLRPS